LAADELSGFRLGLLHGRMTPEEKRQAMHDFSRGEIQVLIATTVVEVGVDVPNATLMAIEDADRLGLAQLHQLRGRVGRGRHPGFVCAFTDSSAESARERLEAFANTRDGFALAELDFRQRGPGTLFSLQQHGLPPFRIADLLGDADCLDEAREDAQLLVTSGALLADPGFAALRRMVQRRYGRVMELADVG
jgi:ATP-dependent DNA helicase RecG